MFPFPGLVLAALAQLLDLTRTTVNLVTNLLSLAVSDNRIFPLFSANVAAVTVYGFFLSMQQLRGHAHVMDICRRCLYGMHKTAFSINTDVRLVAEVPGVALFRLVGVRIALFVLVFGGRWRGNYRGVHNRSLFEDQLFFLQSQSQ